MFQESFIVWYSLLFCAPASVLEQISSFAQKENTTHFGFLMETLFLFNSFFLSQNETLEEKKNKNLLVDLLNH